jgi:hypothetical protein
MSPSAISTSYASASLKRDTALGQFLEALVVVLFACACGILTFGYSLKVSLLLVALFLFAALVIFVSALKLSYRVAEATAIAEDRTRYEITPLRVTVLKQAKVADDVTEYLEKFMEGAQSPDLMTKEDLLLLLRRGLGAERTAEVESDVLKYTRVHDESS